MTVSIDYMGHALRLRLPAIALSASLAYFARIDAFPLVPPAYLPSSREQSQIDGPTLEDIEHYNRSSRTWTVPRGPGFPDTDLPISSSSGLSPSACHDWDWVRGVTEGLSGTLPRYTPGILTGKWRGTILAPYDRNFMPFMTGEVGPASLPGQARIPFFCSLEEHVRYSSPKSCPSGDEWDDPSHMPLFSPTTWTRKEDGVELVDGCSDTKRDSESGADQEIVDVILSGKTEVHLQPAWGNYEFSGRVRISDGLVVLVRQPLNAQGGKLSGGTIYAGYVLSSQNFVGKWKYCSPGAAQWEGVWSLCKAE